MSLGGGGSSVGGRGKKCARAQVGQEWGLRPNISPCHIIIIIKYMKSDFVGAEGGLPTFKEHFILQAFARYMLG